MQSSSTTINPSGTGLATVYVSASASGLPTGDTIYMTNDEGETYDLTLSNGYIIVREYTTPGTYTWSKPGGIDYIQVVCVGGGGGGGGGAKGTTGGAGGGGGGAGGNMGMQWFDSSSLITVNYTIQVGAGGDGGAGATVAGAGSAGTLGGNSVFKETVGLFNTLVSGSGGNPGNGGTTTAGGAGGVDGLTVGIQPSFLVLSHLGSRGGAGGFNAAATSPNLSNDFNIHALNGYYGLGGGGGGGSINTIGTPLSGATGSGIYKYGTLVYSGSAGGAGTGTNGDNGAFVVDGYSLLMFSSSLTSSYGIGTAGHGGGSGDAAGTINGGNGGSGSIGAGGGGGGGARSTANGGNGGKGGDGYVLIIEYH